MNQIAPRNSVRERYFQTWPGNFWSTNMKGNKPMKTITNIIDSAFTLFALAYFALAPTARAVCQHGCDLTNLNTFLGDNALINNTTGDVNTATGASALGNNTTGSGNTATGFVALVANTTGNSNTATGQSALLSNNNGSFNTATGASALEENFGGSNNTATGYDA